MKRTLLTFTAITSLLLPLAAPVVAAAQDGGRQRESAVQRRVEAAQRQLNRDTRAQRAPEARQERRQERPQERSEPRREQRPQGQADSPPQRRGDNAQRQPDRGQREQRRDYRQDRRNESPVQRRVEEAQRQLDRANGVRPDQSRDRNRDNRDNRRWDTRRDRPNAENRRDNYREFQRRWNAQQWRRDFNRDRRSDWWRNDNRFRGWSGVRTGFYFAPGYGYYNVPRTYWNRQWQIGQYLPDVFWRYQVNDYRTYGLGYPPEGTRWVYVDNAIYLIDEYDGYIVEVIRDAWRW